MTGAFDATRHPGLRDGVRRTGVALLLVLFMAAAGAQLGVPSIDQVKAAYIHKFAGYVDWPPAAFADSSTPLLVGIIGSEAVYTELARIVEGRPVQGHPVQVRRLTRREEAAGVHVIFIGEKAWKDTAAWLAAVKGHPVAVVTDAPRGADLGALLTFVQIKDRLRFEASLPAAEQAGLKLSSRLLAVAERVIGAGS